MQAQLIEQIDALTQRVYAIAESMGLERPRKIQYRLLQAVILTSEAFFNMTPEEAADAMGVTTDSVWKYIQRARSNANVARFIALWSPEYRAGSFANPLDISIVDESTIARTF